MLFKVVLGNQIRVFDCKETPSMKAIHTFVEKAFHLPRGYFIYYIDEDQDQITLQSDSDLNIYIADNKKPKIFLQPALQDVFDKTVKIQIEEKEHQKEILPDHLLELEKSINLSQKVQKKEERNQKVENVELEEKPKKQLAEHPAACDLCCQEPIMGDRYKCAVCKNFDLCSECQSKKGHQHPLIKIRQTFQAPLDFLIVPQQSPQEAAKKSLIADRLKNSKCGKKQKMEYETLVEREQVILSILGSLLGEDEFAKHKEFSKICKAETYEDVLEDYIRWQEEQKVGLKKIFGWLKKQIAVVTSFKPF